MAQRRGSDRPFTFNSLLKMLLSPNSPSSASHDEADVPEDLDEPPDHHLMHSTHIHHEDAVVFAPMVNKKESLLTRALKSSPEMSPTEPHPSLHDSIYTNRSYPFSNISGISTAELTSDGGMTSPSLSNTPSPPLPPQMMAKHISFRREVNFSPKVKVVTTGETTVEANLGRKRCVSFACGRKTDTGAQNPTTTPTSSKNTPQSATRKSTLTFVCPGSQPTIQRERSPARKNVFRSRCRGSPAPVARKTSLTAESLEKKPVLGITTSGLGKFENSEATRFHEFASSMDDDDEWVKTSRTDFAEKITLNDCMKKENAIRRLGEEAEEEGQEEDDENEDIADDDSTVHDFSSDDGNESDNEEGFAESDNDDDGSDYEWWAPSTNVSDSNIPTIDIAAPAFPRRASNTSIDSMTDDYPRWSPAPIRRMSGSASGRRASNSNSKPIKMRPRTPKLPDSTDFVCGTLDEDRPLEAAYKSCLEQRRLSRHVLIPQDIDPSFPTSDLDENEEDIEDLSDDCSSDLEPVRGRAEAPVRVQSPKRLVSPPPPTRRNGRTSPKRLKSPPPRPRAKSPSPKKWKISEELPVVESTQGMNISHLVQRPSLTRTKSLPRTPNPFFTSLDKSHRWVGIPPLTESPEREHSRTRELHTRGPIDIVEGLEKKRQKRKEKFWRQHCRKAAKEQMERRPIPGKGAERMKELGLEVAERCRAYGVGEDTQLVLSV